MHRKYKEGFAGKEGFEEYKAEKLRKGSKGSTISKVEIATGGSGVMGCRFGSVCGGYGRWDLRGGHAVADTVVRLKSAEVKKL